MISLFYDHLHFSEICLTRIKNFCHSYSKAFLHFVCVLILFYFSLISKMKRPIKNLRLNYGRKKIVSNLPTAKNKKNIPIKKTQIETEEKIEQVSLSNKTLCGDIDQDYQEYQDYGSESEHLPYDISSDSDESVNQPSTSTSNASGINLINGFIIETVVKKDGKKPDLSGRRIFEPNFFINAFQKLNNHGVGCSVENLVFIKEQFQGLTSKLFFKCNFCNLEVSICTTSDFKERNSEDSQDKVMTLNYAAACAIMGQGGGFTQLTNFMGILSIPSMATSTYQRVNNKLKKDLIAAAEQSMKHFAAVEREKAIENNDVDEGKSIHNILYRNKILNSISFYKIMSEWQIPLI
jgi:hypothetical protein